MRKKEKVGRAGLCISAITTILLLLSLVPFSARAEEYYKFERMWPVLKQPWYFNDAYDISIDLNGYVYVADPYNNRIQKYTTEGWLVKVWGARGYEDGQFYQPCGVCVDTQGYIYVADTFNHRIQKFTDDGQFVKAWGSLGTGNGQFDEPYGVCVNAQGYVYVTDTLNRRIQKFTNDGQFVKAWGDNGTGDGQFQFPWGIAGDTQGYIYVADTGNKRIQKFTNDGQFEKAWDGVGTGAYRHAIRDVTIDASGIVYITDASEYGGSSIPQEIQSFTTDGQFISSWGVWGNGDGQLYSPLSIAADPEGYLYVSDWAMRIQKFTNNGQFVNAWASGGNREGQFLYPNGIATDAQGFFYIADNHNDRIQKFTQDGQFVKAWGDQGDGQMYSPNDLVVNGQGYVYVAFSNNTIQKFSSNGEFVKAWGSAGIGQGEFNYPTGISLDSQGYIYVAEYYNNRIQKFTSDGQFVKFWGTQGSGDGQFNNPWDIVVDPQGNVYVTDTSNYRVQKFTSDGVFIKSWGQYGTENGNLITPSVISIDDDGYIYVADSGNHRIQKFTNNGQFVTVWGEAGTSPGQFSYPIGGLTISQNGKVYVADSSSNRIQVFKKVDVLDNPKAIIVAGGGPGEWNSLWDATQLNANYAYRALTFQGYTKQSIFYLSANTDLDLDGNGLADDVDNDSTSANLEYAITQWAADADSVIIYLVDHGGDGTFRMGESDILTAEELDGWIDQLQSVMSGRVIVVYDACESGSFQNDLQGSDRTIITSTSEGERAKFLNQGSMSFSFFFWTYIFNGMTLEEAFNAAAQNINFAFDSQTPVASGLEPGVVVGNGVDQHFGQAPVIGQVSPPQTLTTETSATIYASDITYSGVIERVWAVIWRPNVEVGSPDSPAVKLPEIELVYNGAQSRYEGVYDNCTTDGTYQVAVYAYGDGLTSLPKLTTIAKNYYLKRRVILCGSTETSGMPWGNIEKSLQSAYGAVRAQGYADDTELKVYAPLSIPGVTATVSMNTFDNLEYAITQWAATDTQDLVLYLVGAGTDNGSFRLNDTDTLTASVLDGWLYSLQGQIAGKVIVVYDADSSGSFIPLLTPPGGRQRIVITSAGAGGAAYFSAEGNLSFSFSFWSQIASGATVYSSFVYAQKAIAYLSREGDIGFSCYLDQSPALDDNGNGIGNEETDGAVARKTSIGMGLKFAADPPQIGSAEAQNSTGGILITASNISTTGTIESVWAIVTPLGYCPGGTGTEPAQVVKVAMAEDNGTAGTYRGMYTGIVQACKIAVYARDTDNQTSPPQQTKVYQSQGADMYEVDDNASCAGVIIINQGAVQADSTKMGLGQPHNFHYAADEDWVMLYGLAGQDYTVQVDNLGVNCQPVMELYGADVTAPIAVTSTVIDNMVFLDWQCPQDGVYYVRLWNSAGAVTDTEYELAVYYPEMPVLGLIKGSIRDTGGSPILNAVITTNGGYSALGNNGWYEMPHKGGAYTLTADAAGYQTYTQAGINLGERETLQLDIVMTPAGGGTTTTVPAGGTTTTVPAGGTTTSTVSGSSTTTMPGDTTTTTTVRRWCPLRKALGDGSEAELEALRIFRDARLAKSAEGARLVSMYYRHAAELTLMFERRPEIAAQVRELVLDLLPQLGGQQKLVLSNDMKQQMFDLIDELRTNASPGLRKTLRLVRKIIEKGEVPGELNP